MNSTYLWLGLPMLLLAVFSWFAFNSYTDCTEAGGTLVRGLLWFVCMKGGAA